MYTMNGKVNIIPVAMYNLRATALFCSCWRLMLKNECAFMFERERRKGHECVESEDDLFQFDCSRGTKFNLHLEAHFKFYSRMVLFRFLSKYTAGLIVKEVICKDSR